MPPRRSRPDGTGAHQARRLNRIIDLFKEFDGDGSGALTTDEIMLILTRECNGRAMSQAEAKRFLDRFDRNKDGQLDIKEFSVVFDAMEKEGGIVAASTTKMTKDDWLALRHFDDDASGVLEMDELLTILLHSNGKAKGMPEDEARAFISMFDSDGNGNIDATEFAAFHRGLWKGEGGAAGYNKAKEIKNERKRQDQKFQESRLRK